MNISWRYFLTIVGLLISISAPKFALAQNPVGASGVLDPLLTTPAVSGYEQELAGLIRSEYAKYGKVVKDTAATVD